MMMQWCDDGDNIDDDNGDDNGDDDSKSCQQGDPTKDQQRWPAGKGGGRGEPRAVSCCHHWLQLLAYIYITVYYSMLNTFNILQYISHFQVCVQHQWNNLALSAIQVTLFE